MHRYAFATANAATRSATLDRLKVSDVSDIISETARRVEASLPNPHRTDVFAFINAVELHAKSLPAGDEVRSKLVQTVIAAKTRIREGWLQLANAIERQEAIDRAYRTIDGYRAATDSTELPVSVKMDQWQRKQKAA
jgi:hypothetical protein